MTPQERYCTLWGVAVILAFVAFAFYLDPPSGLKELIPFGGEDCGSQADHYGCQLARYTHQLAWFTGALFIATILLFVIGYYQVRQLSRHADHTENLVATARDTAERPLRAYLQLVPDLNSFIWINTVHVPELRVSLKNAGQTPAYDVQANGAINPDAYPLRKTPPDLLPVDEPFQLVIHPGELGYTMTLTAGRRLSPDEVDRLTDGTDLRLYLYGGVTYKDAFGKDRYTRFRLMTRRNVEGGQGRFVYCNQGNEAT